MARTEQEGKPKTEEKREGRLHDVAAQARVGRERQSSRGARGVDLGRGQITSRRELGLRRQERLLLGDEPPLVRDDAPLRLDAAPRVGHTDETAADGRYVNATPLAENCWPFDDTSTRRAPAPDDGGDAHSSWPPPTRRAADVAPLASKRQRSVAASRNVEPTTDTRVPPATGPDGGTSALTRSAPCT